MFPTKDVTASVAASTPSPPLRMFEMQFLLESGVPVFGELVT
jgi:hypothetical protein